MNTEIERKFLIRPGKRTVSRLCDIADRVTHNLQGYLSFNPEVRVRRTITIKDRFAVVPLGYQYSLTVKGEGTISRTEIDVSVPPDRGEQLIQTASPNGLLDKIRFEKEGWEIDQFREEYNGLFLAEIELKHEQEDITDALAYLRGGLEFDVVKEVTEDPSFKNKNIVNWTEHTFLRLMQTLEGDRFRAIL